MQKSSAEVGWKVRVSLSCNFLVTAALGLCYELVRRPLFSGFMKLHRCCLGAGKEGQFKCDGIRQKEELILTPVLSKRQGRGKVAVSFCLLILFSPQDNKISQFDIHILS